MILGSSQPLANPAAVQVPTLNRAPGAVCAPANIYAPPGGAPAFADARTGASDPRKLAVYVITDPKAHKIFLLQALKRSPRGKEAVDVQLRGDTPQIVISAGADEKPTEAGVTAQASRAVASALLNVKAGTTTDDAGLPGWLEAGFGNAVALRVDGNASKLAAHRAKVKALAQKSQGQALQLKAVYGDAPSADADVLVTSFLEYLVFGPGAEKFPAILTALKPGEGNETPTIWTAFTAADWKTEAVEANWRRWVLTGK